MAGKSRLSINRKLDYARAGVVFQIQVELPEERAAHQGASLNIEVVETDSGNRVSFGEEVCPVLADFVPGFVRWLGRKGVSAQAGDGVITSNFDKEFTRDQIKGTTEEVCELIDSRFSLYTEGILEKAPA